MPNGGRHLRSGFFGEMEENGNKKERGRRRKREKREMRWLRNNKSRSHGRVCRASVC